VSNATGGKIPHLKIPAVRTRAIAEARVAVNGGEAMSGKFSRYRRKQIAELRPYEPGENLDGVSISTEDRKAGSPKAGDMIARNPNNHDDQWLVSAAYFAENFEPI
jgi:hypothetical protein